MTWRIRGANFFESKLFIVFSLFLLFGMVSVLAGSLIVNESGIQITADKYFSSYGQEGLTSNISFIGTDGENYSLVVQNGLIVDTHRKESNSTSNQSESFPNAGLIAYYKLDETSGQVIDSLSNNNGTNNGATANVIGKINNSYGFKEVESDYINIGSNTIDLTSPPISINAWIKIDSIKENSIIGAGTSNGYAFYVKSNSQLSFGKLDVNEVVSEELVTNETWHMVTSVYNEEGVTFYIDGNLSGNSSYDKNFSSELAYNIGKRKSEAYFDGKIDELGIWNISLDATEVDNLYNNGNGLIYST